jgi:hypothetical protein
VLCAADVAVVFPGGFEELVTAVSGFASDALHFPRGGGWKLQAI